MPDAWHLQLRVGDDWPRGWPGGPEVRNLPLADADPDVRRRLLPPCSIRITWPSTP